jgi:hypothetical protein
MRQKEVSSVVSGAQARNKISFPWKNKYVCLQQENQRLKNQFRKILKELSQAGQEEL